MTEHRLRLPLVCLDPTLDLPAYAHPTDAGLDLRSTQECVLQPFERALIPTGIKIAIPEGYAGFVLCRSGRAVKEGLSIVNAPGLIDAHYRGEIMVCVINLDPHTPIEIHKNERIAQLVIQKIDQVELTFVEELDETDRGNQGFGSTGVH